MSKLSLSAIIQENLYLKKRLQKMEIWIRRQFQESKNTIQKQQAIQRIRKHFDNLFEEQFIHTLRENFQTRYPYIDNISLDRLVDAEILWYMHQKYPHMDGIAVSILYQKILDAWIESKFVAHWRNVFRSGSFPYHTSGIDKDLLLVASKKYSLSLGRFYHILAQVRKNECSPICSNFAEVCLSYNPGYWTVILTDAFFDAFRRMIDLGLYSTKRHTEKVTFSDMMILRECMLREDGILTKIFTIFPEVQKGSTSV